MHPVEIGHQGVSPAEIKSHGRGINFGGRANSRGKDEENGRRLKHELFSIS